MSAKSLEPVTIGSCTQIKAQSIKAGNKVLPHSKVLLLTDGDLTMPDMSGWTKEDVIAFENLTNIKVNLRVVLCPTNQLVRDKNLLKTINIRRIFIRENVDSKIPWINSYSNSDDKKSTE